MAMLSRKDFLRSALCSAVVATLPLEAIAGQAASQAPAVDISIEDLKAFAKIAGLSFSDAELKEILPDVKDWLAGYKSLRGLNLPFEVEPPTVFMPKTHRAITAKPGITVKVSPVGTVKRPSSDEDLAFMSVKQLGQLLKTRQVTSVELTQLYLSRLQKYGDALQCVITLMPEQALARAQQADLEIKAGHYRGALHGIPCGIKDLFAMRGAPTTWRN